MTPILDQKRGIAVDRIHQLGEPLIEMDYPDGSICRDRRARGEPLRACLDVDRGAELGIDFA